MPVTLTPNPTTDQADGYYVSRAIVIDVAGTDNFGLTFNLDAIATTADEAVAQRVFDDNDGFVDERAIVLNVTADAGATAPHYVATDNPIYPGLRRWASRRARADGYLLRGDTGNPQAGPEGQMRATKIEAEKRIDELLLSMYQAGLEGAANSGITVIGGGCGCPVPDTMSACRG